MFTQTPSAPSASSPKPFDRLARAASRLSWPLPVDAFLQLVDPLWSSTSVRGRVEAVIPETARAATLVVRPGRGWQGHRAGQWVGIGIDIDGVRHRRCYSLTGPAERADGCITITVQSVPGGLVSNHLVHRTTPGTIVHLDQASGDFVLPEARTRGLLFVTAGSGITPVMGMLRTLAAVGPIEDVTVLHFARTEAEVIFGAELAALADQHPGLTVDVALTGEAGPGDLSARFGTERLAARCPDWAEREVWACGPATLLAAVEDHWASADLAERLHVERFTPLTVAAGEPGQGGRIRFTRSDREIVVDGRTTVLEAAEQAGLLPESGCRMGICHTCTRALEAGCVRDKRDGRLQRDAGDIVQICVATPAGDVEIDL
ncbi:MAG: ferredoxin [Acidimicrobiales bacterium]|nr:ferredoxin [Acidimicrobiales bacterium]